MTVQSKEETVANTEIRDCGPHLADIPTFPSVKATCETRFPVVVLDTITASLTFRVRDIRVWHRKVQQLVPVSGGFFTRQVTPKCGIVAATS